MILFFLDFPQQVAGEDEGVESFIGRAHYLVLRAFPFLVTIADEEDTLAYAEHRIHVVCVDDGRHAVFVRDAADQVVDDKACLGIET